MGLQQYCGLRQSIPWLHQDKIKAHFSKILNNHRQPGSQAARYCVTMNW